MRSFARSGFDPDQCQKEFDGACSGIDRRYNKGFRGTDEE
jgi:hypothetical protein